MNFTRLKNGLSVISDCVPSVETVAVGVWVGRGARHESHNGISHFLEHMAFKGTKRRSAQKIAEEIENVGGYLNAYTARESTAYYGRVLRDDTHLLMDILADILQFPVFDEREFQKERTVILQEIAQTTDTPDDIIFDYLQSKSYPNQALGWPILGDVQTLMSLTPDHLRSHMRQHYTPENIVVSASGAIDHDEFAEWVEDMFNALTPASSSPNLVGHFHAQSYHESRDLEQVHVAMSFEACSYHQSERHAVSILSTVLAGGMSSRLFQEIREKYGLVYGIQSFPSFYEDSGTLSFYASTEPQHFEKLKQLMYEQFENITQDVLDAEINRAKSQMKASFFMSFEAMFDRCERLALHTLMYGRPLMRDEIIQSIENVTKEQVLNIAQKIFSSPMTLVTIGKVS